MMTDLAADAVTHRTIQWKFGTLSFRDAGAPHHPAVVMLHGVGSGAASWLDQLIDLPRHGFRAIAWDQPGYGISDALPMESPSPDDYAAALMGLVEALQLDSFVLLGHSLGALVAGSFAAGGGGSRVQKLVLASPTAGFAGAPPEVLEVKVQRRIDDMMQGGPAVLAQRRAAALLSPSASPAAVQRVRAVMSGLNPHGYVQAVRMLGRADLLGQAPRLSQPALVLSGTADEVTPEAGCRRIAAALPRADYVPLPGLGHACYVEDAQAFDAALLHFLEPVKA